MDLQVESKNFVNPVQIKRRQIRLRREKEHAIAQYKKMVKKARKNDSKLTSLESVSINHAITFTFALSIGSIFLPELAGLSVVLAVFVIGKLLYSKENKNIVDSEHRVLTAYERERMKMVRPYKVNLSSKKKTALPVSKTEKGFSFKDEDGKTISQFDWRQLTQ